MNKIKVALFDIDNILVFGEDARQYYKQYSFLVETTFSLIRNISYVEAVKIVNEYRKKFNGRGEKVFEDYSDNSSFYDAICSLDPALYIKPIQKTQKLLRNLKNENLILGAITDGPTKQAYKILQSAGIDSNIFSL